MEIPKQKAISTLYDYNKNRINDQSYFNTGFQVFGRNAAEVNAMLAEKDLANKNEAKRQLYETRMKKYNMNVEREKLKKKEDKIYQNQLKQITKNAQAERDIYNNMIRQNNYQRHINYLQRQMNEPFPEGQNTRSDDINHTGRSRNQSTKQKSENHLSESSNKKGSNDLNASSDHLSSENKDIVPSQVNVDLTEKISSTIKDQLREKQSHPVKYSYKSDALSVELLRKNNYNPLKPSVLQTQETEVSIKKKAKIPRPKFKTELERKMFIKALKEIMTERLGERRIIIPNLCSCGNLQKKLEAVVWEGNVSILYSANIDCANNCVYYQNKELYMKDLKEIISCIKGLGYTSFNNKYKD